jgi:hypothetical protein
MLMWRGANSYLVACIGRRTRRRVVSEGLEGSRRRLRDDGRSCHTDEMLRRVPRPQDPPRGLRVPLDVARWQTASVSGSEFEVQLEFDWSEAVDAAPQYASQFLVQIGMPANGRPDGIHLVIGHVNPPLIVSDDEESRRRQLARYEGQLPIKVHGRYVFSRAKLEELRSVLNNLAEKYDELDAAAGEQA